MYYLRYMKIYVKAPCITIGQWNTIKKDEDGIEKINTIGICFMYLCISNSMILPISITRIYQKKTFNLLNEHQFDNR